MKRIVLITILCLFYYWSFSQKDTTIRLLPNWKNGETRKYEIKKYINADAENKSTVNNQTTKIISIQIVNSKDTLQEIIWKNEKLNFSDTINTDNPFMSLMNTLDKDITVRYTVNKKGNIVSILNLDEISKTIKSRVDVVLKDFIKKNNIEKSKAEMLNFQFTMMFSTDDQIKTIVLTDILQFHQIYGYSFTTNQTTIIPDNIFAPGANGEPSNNLELKFEQFDKQNKFLCINGELKCAQKDKRLREFIDKDRKIKHLYKFKYPDNWLISYKSIMNVGGGGMNMNSVYEINWLE